MCGKGVLAMVRPFQVGSWEVGQYDIDLATKYVDFDIKKVLGKGGYLQKIGPVPLAEIEEMIRLVGAGPALRHYSYHDNVKKMEHVLVKLFPSAAGSCTGDPGYKICPCFKLVEFLHCRGSPPCPSPA